MGKKTGKDVKCENCGKLHYRSGWQLKIKTRYFCSRSCADKAHSALLTKHEYKQVKCLECGKEFKQHWKGPKKFCSTKCSARYNLSVINSKEPTKKGTKPEKEFAKLLEELDVEFIFQHPVPWKKGWKKWYDFYLPQKNLLIEAGTKLVFNENSYLIVNGGSLKILGSEKENVILTSKKGFWKGFYVINSPNKSFLKNVSISNVTFLRDGILDLTGAITFYRSDVDFLNVKFLNYLSPIDSLSVLTIGLSK